MSSTDPSGSGASKPSTPATSSAPSEAHTPPRVEELLARAERVLRQPVPPPSTFARLRWPLVGAGVVATLLLIAALTSGSGDNVSGQTTAVPLASTTSAVATTVPIVITLPPNSLAATTTDAATTTAPDTPRTTAFGAPARTISFENGTLVLRGAVADQATADAIRSALAASFGAAAIVDQFQIAGDAPSTNDDPLSAGTAVRFVDGQPVTDLASLRFLDEVADLLGRHPGVTADIHVSADGGGVTLAAQRANTIRQYLGGRGIAADRLASTGDPASAPTAQLVVVLHHLAG